jgi:hypothetical protein
MGATIGDYLPLALGVALSPVPIVGVILMLISARGRTNALAFLGGWLLAILVVCALVATLAGGATTSAGGSPSTVGAVIKLVLGLALLVLALRQWRSQPKEGEEPHVPKWMQTIDAFTPAKSFGFGALLAAANPKNLPLIIAAGTTVAAASLTTGQQIVAVVVYTLLATLGPGLPLLVYRFGGKGAEKTLNGWKTWLIAHNGAIMAVLLLVFGVKLVGDGVSGLF